MIVLDYSSTPPRTFPGDVAGVMRYIAPRRADGTRRPKSITNAELAAHRAARRSVGFVFEASNSNWAGGARQGDIDGRVAVLELTVLGVPKGVACYAAVDRDTTAADLPTVAAYLDAFHRHTAAAGYRRGVYGEYDVVVAMLRGGHAQLAWQCSAWSHGHRAQGIPGVALFQRVEQRVLDGTPCDVNEIWLEDWGQWRVTMPHIEDVLLFAIAQRGDRYVFGTEVDPLHPDSDLWDCSELVEISCAQAHVLPTVPDGAYGQWVHTKPLAIPVADALRTRGALLFHGSGAGTGRDAISHVAISLGDHTTVEARGAAWGVGTWAADGRFQFAARIPGVDYAPRPIPAHLLEDDMQRIMVPTWAKRDPATNLAPAFRLDVDPAKPAEAIVVALNGAQLAKPTGVYGHPYAKLTGLASPAGAVAEIEDTGAIVVQCTEGHQYDIARRP